MRNLPNTTVFYTIEKTIKLYRTMAEKAISHRLHDLNLDQALMMLFVKNQPEVTHSELAAILFLEPVRVTQLLIALESSGYIIVEDHHTFKLTLQGEEAYKVIEMVVMSNRYEALKGVSIEDIKATIRVLQAITLNCASVVQPAVAYN